MVRSYRIMGTIGFLWGQLFIGVRHAQLPVLHRDRGDDYWVYLLEGLGRTEQFASHLWKSGNPDSLLPERGARRSEQECFRRLSYLAREDDRQIGRASCRG